MFYEMLTGEKPFPGQSVTTVIYKIVNEEPVPPRQLNPSIHPGLNDIVMRALAKEPELRYQSCREMQEDLKNYRSMGTGGANPDATMVSTRPNGGGLIGPAGGGLRGLHGEDPMSSPTLRSLQSRVSNPSQTPAIRRTAAVQPYVEPKKNSPVGTIFAALLLVGVIAYGGYKLRPELQAARERNSTVAVAVAPSSVPTPASSPATPAQTVPQTTDSTTQTPAKENTPAATDTLPDQPVDSATKNSATPPISEAIEKSSAPAAAPAPVVEKTATKKDPDAGLSQEAAAYKAKIVEAIAQRNLADRVKVIGTGNTLTMKGKLRPAEHSSLLHFMRNAPAAVHVVDDILYDDTAASGGDKADSEGHPVPAKGKAAVHLITDVLGATATLYGPGGKELSDCQTPCSFNNLAPAHYSLQIQKDGYQSMQTAVELKAGEAQDQKFHLEAVAKGLFVSSTPSGAEVFIDGAIQAGQTPVTLPLAAGQFNLVLRMNGYEPFAGQVQVKDNVQTVMNVEMVPRAIPHAAWAQVNTTPKGAEIFVDGMSTGKASPARVQIVSGDHILVMKLSGYQVARRAIEVSEGGTVTVNEAMKAKE